MEGHYITANNRRRKGERIPPHPIGLTLKGYDIIDDKVIIDGRKSENKIQKDLFGNEITELGLTSTGKRKKGRKQPHGKHKLKTPTIKEHRKTIRKRNRITKNDILALEGDDAVRGLKIMVNNKNKKIRSLKYEINLNKIKCLNGWNPYFNWYHNNGIRYKGIMIKNKLHYLIYGVHCTHSDKLDR
eukprot:59931_1